MAAQIRTAEMIAEMRAEIREELQCIRAEIAALRNTIGELQVHSARQNGNISNTEIRLKAIESRIASLPCDRHTESIAELRRSDMFNRRGWGYVISVVIQIVLMAIGGLVGYFLGGAR